MDSKFSMDRLQLHKGVLGLCALPATDGDRAALMAFEPALVVSMTTREEMEARGAATLPIELAGAGIGWAHFPISDFETPAPEQNARWSALSGRIHAVLAEGGRVALHCRAGLGRTGMVALRLMIEAGEDPEAALERLREQRPGSVETEAQAAWAKQGPVPGAADSAGG